MLDPRLLLKERNDDREGTVALVHESFGLVALAGILPAMDRPSHWILALITVFFAITSFWR